MQPTQCETASLDEFLLGFRLRAQEKMSDKARQLRFFMLPAPEIIGRVATRRP